MIAKSIKSILLLIMISIGMCSSCKNDDETQEDNTNGETTLENLSGLEEDSQYIDYVNNLYTVSKQVKDPEKVRSIINSAEVIAESQKEELALAMGFVTIEDLENFYTEQTNLLSAVLRKYDFNNNDISLSSVFNRLMQSNYPTRPPSATNKLKLLKNDDIPEECLDIWDVCDSNLFIDQPNLNNPEFLQEFYCSDFSLESASWNQCMEKVYSNLAAEWSALQNEWCRCMEADCNWPESVYDACRPTTTVPRS